MHAANGTLKPEKQVSLQRIERRMPRRLDTRIGRGQLLLIALDDQFSQPRLVNRIGRQKRCNARGLHRQRRFGFKALKSWGEQTANENLPMHGCVVARVAGQRRKRFQHFPVEPCLICSKRDLGILAQINANRFERQGMTADALNKVGKHLKIGWRIGLRSKTPKERDAVRRFQPVKVQHVQFAGTCPATKARGDKEGSPVVAGQAA